MYVFMMNKHNLYLSKWRIVSTFVVTQIEFSASNSTEREKTWLHQEVGIILLKFMTLEDRVQLHLLLGLTFAVMLLTSEMMDTPCSQGATDKKMPWNYGISEPIRNSGESIGMVQKCKKAQSSYQIRI